MPKNAPYAFTLRSDEKKMLVSTVGLASLITSAPVIVNSPIVARGSWTYDTATLTVTPIDPIVGLSNAVITSLGGGVWNVRVELDNPVSNSAQVLFSVGDTDIGSPNNILNNAALDNASVPGSSFIDMQIGSAGDRLYLAVLDTTATPPSPPAISNGAVVARGTFDTAQTTGASTPRLPMMNVVGCTDEGKIPQTSPPYPAWVLNPSYDAWSYRVELAIRLSDSATIVHTLFQPLELLAIASWVFIDNTTSPTVSYLNIQISDSVPVPFGPAHFGFNFIVTDVGSV